MASLLTIGLEGELVTGHVWEYTQLHEVPVKVKWVINWTNNSLSPH